MYVKTHYNSVVISLQLIKISEKSLLQGHSSKGIDVCHLSVMSYSPCWNLTTKTEFKQYAKMRIKTQWPTYIHLAKGVAPVVFKGALNSDLRLRRSHAGIGPGNPEWVIKHNSLYFGCHSCFVFFDWEDFSKLLLCMLALADKMFHGIDLMGKIISEIYPFILSS